MEDGDGMNANGTKSLRLAYMGTADFAVPALRALAASRHQVAAVYTQPARSAGRGLRPRPSPVERTAVMLDLPTLTPVSLKEEKTRAAFASLDVDLAVVAAYGLILPQAFLDLPRLGCINLHGSCLPRWRGAAPVQRAIEAGDSRTGVTIIQMDAGLDTGPILAMEPVPIGPKTTARELHDRLASLAADMVVPMVDRLAEGPVTGTPQTESGARYARKIEKNEGCIDWRQPAAIIERRLRAFNPWPGCWTGLGDQRLRLLRGDVVQARGTASAPPGTVLDDHLAVACGEGVLRLAEVQRPGGKAMPADEFLRGFPLPAGTRLGAPCPATS